jgi:hypothetical protein
MPFRGPAKTTMGIASLFYGLTAALMADPFDGAKVLYNE